VVNSAVLTSVYWIIVLFEVFIAWFFGCKFYNSLDL
jgi:hypothetical protein